MHEMSLAVAMMDQLQPYFESESVQQVVQIDVELGALSCVEKDAFDWAFAAAAEGTPAAGAELRYAEVPVSVQCVECGLISQPPFPAMVCMGCHATDVTITAGKDFKIRSMEVR